MPSGAGDVLVLKEVTPGVSEALWPQMKLSSSSGDPVGCLFNVNIARKLKIPYSLCTFDDPDKAVITLEFV